MNKRLITWAEENEKLLANQFGFRPNKSTIDAIFVLHGIISHTLQNKEKLFCAFVDFCKAFDNVDRRILWYKLFNSGISSKTITMIKSIYATVRLRVKTDGEFSEVFENISCVKQGEPLSPLLFIFFINDIAKELETSNNDDFVSVNGILIHLLLFADDTVLFGKTPEALQLLLDKLLKYCSKWNIEVNKDKTEIIVFRNGWQQVNHSWYYDKHELKVVNSFVYLGNLFHYNGKFQQTQKRLSQQANKALASLFNSFKMLYISTQQKCEMFDSLVGSILSYGSEIWGFHHARDIERVYNKFCRFVLKVGKNDLYVLLSVNLDICQCILLENKEYLNIG